MLIRAPQVFQFAHGHPLTQRIRSHYARLLLDTGRTAEALACAEAALAMHETTSGPDHNWTVNSARVTADALDALGRSEEVASLRERYGVTHTIDEQGTSALIASDDTQ